MSLPARDGRRLALRSPDLVRIGRLSVFVFSWLSASAFAALTEAQMKSAAEGPDLQRVEQMVAANGGPKGSTGGSLLLKAAWTGNIRVVERLLSLGVPIDFTTETGASAGRTALIYASMRGHEEVVKLLIDHGADVKFIGRCTEPGCDGHTAIRAAAEGDRLEIAQRLLDAGADPSEAASCAVEAANLNGNVALYKLLLAHGGHEWTEHPYARSHPGGTEPAKATKDAAPAAAPMLGLTELLPGAASSGREVARSGKPTRLAIFADEDNAAGADALAASLKGAPEIELVDRKEADRRMAEQKLSRAPVDASQAAKLGELLRADALYSLRSLDLRGQRVVEMRFVRVVPGLVLATRYRPAPLGSPDSWSAAAVSTIRELAAKSLRPDAIAVSVLNVRSAMAGEEALALERTLNALLTERLTNDGRFVVLERTEMSRLSEAAASKQSFWAGKYWVDGAVEPALNGSGDFEVRLRLQSANGEGKLEGHAKGNVNAPAKAIDEALHAALAQLPAGEAGGSAAEMAIAPEAERYVAEAKWALQAGVPKVAQRAADAAWGLGARRTEVARLRLECAIRTIDLQLADLTKRIPRDPNGWESRDRLNHPLRGPDSLSTGDWLQLTGSMLQDWRETWEGDLLRDSAEQQAWMALGEKAFAAAERALVEVHTAAAKIQHERLLRSVRGSLAGALESGMRLAALLPPAPKATNAAPEALVAFGPGPSLPVPTRLAILEAKFIPTVAWDNDERIKLLEEMLARHFPSHDDLTRAWIRKPTALSWVQLERSSKMRSAMERLRVGAAPEDRLLAAWYGYVTSPLEEKGAMERAALAAFWDLRHTMAKDGAIFTLYEEYVQKMQSGLLALDPERPLGWTGDNSRGSYRDPEQVHFTEEFYAFRRKMVLALLAEGSDLGTAGEWFDTKHLTKDEVPEMAAAIEAWKARAAGSFSPQAQMRLGAFFDFHAPRPAANTASNLLLERHWVAYSTNVGFWPRDITLDFDSLVWAENRVWICGRETDANQKDWVRRLIFRIDPDTLQAEVVELPQRKYEPRSRYETPHDSFVITPERIFYLADAEYLAIEDRATGQWKYNNDIKPQGGCQGLVAGDAVYVPTRVEQTNGLVSYDFRSGATQILVSTRRDPPLSPMDDPRSPGIWQLRATKSGGVAVVAFGRLQLWDPTALLWHPIAQAPALPAWAKQFRRAGFLKTGRLQARGPMPKPWESMTLALESQAAERDEIQLIFDPTSEKWRDRVGWGVDITQGHPEVWAGYDGGIVIPCFAPCLWFLPKADLNKYLEERKRPLFQLEPQDEFLPDQVSN